MISPTATTRSPGETQPRLHQHGRLVQSFDQLRAMPRGLPDIALRTNELQVWFVAEHLVDTPLVKV